MGRNDLTGQRFERLVVLGEAAKDNHGRVTWLCRCDCGEKVVVQAYNLKNGNTKSCGCYKREKAKADSTKHGEVGTRLYTIWKDMRQRCTNPNNRAYSHYGGRGIEICEEWRVSYAAFAEWAMSTGYADNLSIDRIDTNGDYAPDNCRWTTEKVQQNNRTNNRLITVDGVTHTASEWETINGWQRGTIYQRMSRGWTDTRAASEPLHKKKG